jgi:hypothetical protein
MYTIIMYINLVHKRKEDMERGCPHSGGGPIGDDSKTKLWPLPNAVPMPTRETLPDVWFGLGCVKVVKWFLVGQEKEREIFSRWFVVGGETLINRYSVSA